MDFGWEMPFKFYQRTVSEQDNRVVWITSRTTESSARIILGSGEMKQHLARGELKQHQGDGLPTRNSQTPPYLVKTSDRRSAANTKEIILQRPLHSHHTAQAYKPRTFYLKHGQ